MNEALKNIYRVALKHKKPLSMRKVEDNAFVIENLDAPLEVYLSDKAGKVYRAPAPYGMFMDIEREMVKQLNEQIRQIEDQMFLRTMSLFND